MSSCSNKSKIWPRAILLVDMNAFFASVEQRDFPELRAKPIAVTNGTLGSCIITCSYEARAYGIKTGMRVKEAKALCPGLIQRPARPRVYSTVSKSIMEALANYVSPDIEVFSVDEAFIDVTDSQRFIGSPQELGRLAKDIVLKVSGCLSSVGVSGDKTTAKFAAKQNKPNGLTIIEPWNAEKILNPVKVQELCGINNGIQSFLNERGVFTCGDMKKIPISVLGERFGNIGRRIWLMAQGKDIDKVKPNIEPPKSIGHGKVLPPDTRQSKTIRTFLYHMCDKVAFRLRKHDMQSNHFFVGLRLKEQWMKTKFRTVPTNTTQIIYKKVSQFIDDNWRGQGVFAVQVTALNPTSNKGQKDLFFDAQTSPIDIVTDKINEKFGQYSVTKACLMERSEMPDVIAPAWKPDGHRQTIE